MGWFYFRIDILEISLYCSVNLLLFSWLLFCSCFSESSVEPESSEMAAWRTLKVYGPDPCFNRTGAASFQLTKILMRIFPLGGKCPQRQINRVFRRSNSKTQININSKKVTLTQKGNTDIIRAFSSHSFMFLRLGFFIFNVRVTSYLDRVAVRDTGDHSYMKKYCKVFPFYQHSLNGHLFNIWLLVTQSVCKFTSPWGVKMNLILEECLGGSCLFVFHFNLLGAEAKRIMQLALQSI